MEKDTIYQTKLESVANFTFNDQVAAVFPDMINRSVPGYGLVLRLIGLLAGRVVEANTSVYDLGCSVGAGILSICSHVENTRFNIVGIDNSQPMINRCLKNCEEIKNDPMVRLDLICGDIRDIEITNASMILLNYCLQFINPEQRQDFLSKTYRGLNQGACLILSEKINPEEPLFSDLVSDVHEGFKIDNGYSELEISQKRTALENVLIPMTDTQMLKMLKIAGFSQVYCWFQALNFKSVIAIK